MADRVPRCYDRAMAGFLSKLILPIAVGAVAVVAVVAAAAGRFDDEHVAGHQFRPIGSGQHIARSVRAFDPLQTGGAIRAALQAEGGDFAARRDDHGGHRCIGIAKVQTQDVSTLVG